MPAARPVPSAGPPPPGRLATWTTAASWPAAPSAGTILAHVARRHPPPQRADGSLSPRRSSGGGFAGDGRAAPDLGAGLPARRAGARRPRAQDRPPFAACRPLRPRRATGTAAASCPPGPPACDDDLSEVARDHQGSQTAPRNHICPRSIRRPARSGANGESLTTDARRADRAAPREEPDDAQGRGDRRDRLRASCSARRRSWSASPSRPDWGRRSRRRQHFGADRFGLAPEPRPVRRRRVSFSFLGVVRDRIGEFEDRFFATVFLGRGPRLPRRPLLGAASQEAWSPGCRPSGPTSTSGTPRSPDHPHRADVYATKMAGVFMVSAATIAFASACFRTGSPSTGLVVARSLIVFGEQDRLARLAAPGVDPLVSLRILRAGVRASC